MECRNIVTSEPALKLSGDLYRSLRRAVCANKFAGARVGGARQQSETRYLMSTAKLFCALLCVAIPAAAQVTTLVPPEVAGAKPVSVQHIKVHGAALEGNLEGDAVDREVIVFLPPGYGNNQHQRYPVVY